MTNRLLSTFLWLAGAVFAMGATLGAIPAAHAQDIKAGEAKAAMCLGCHNIPGYQASFPDVYPVPMIAGQKADYLAAALLEYKKGERKHPTMRAIAGSLTDKDMADLAAFYEARDREKDPAVVPATLAVAPPAAVAALLQKGNCVSCHGANFDSPLPGYPKLAGQHADYLFEAMKSYQMSTNPKVGRQNAVMVGMIKPFTHAELRQIADYLGSLPTDLRVAPQARFK